MNGGNGYLWLFAPLVGLMVLSAVLPGAVYLPLALAVCALLFRKSGIIRAELRGMDPVRAYLTVIAPFWMFFTLWGVVLSWLGNEAFFFGAVAPLALPVAVVIWPVFRREEARIPEVAAMSPIVYGLAVAAFAGGSLTFVVNS